MTAPPSRTLAVILHADVVGSTALVQIPESVAHERMQDAFRRFSATTSTTVVSLERFEEMRL